MALLPKVPIVTGFEAMMGWLSRVFWIVCSSKFRVSDTKIPWPPLTGSVIRFKNTPPPAAKPPPWAGAIRSPRVSTPACWCVRFSGCDDRRS